MGVDSHVNQASYCVISNEDKNYESHCDDTDGDFTGYKSIS